MSKKAGRPEKIKIDHILDEGQGQDAPEEVEIEVVSSESRGGEVDSAEEAQSEAERGEAANAEAAQEDALTEARQEIERLQEQYLRVRADFENYRKRVERDRSEERARLSAGILGEILPAIDNLDRALEQPADDPGFREGVALIRRQMDESLRKLGLEPIDAIGEPFDPVYHEAMAAESREDFAPNTIIEEIRKGYTLGGRVIRPSLVKVAIPLPTAQAESSGESGETDG